MCGEIENDKVIHLQSRVQQHVYQTNAISKWNKSRNDLIAQWLHDDDEEEDEYEDDFQLGGTQFKSKPGNLLP
jgi:hypothetical protein